MNRQILNKIKEELDCKTNWNSKAVLEILDSVITVKEDLENLIKSKTSWGRNILIDVLKEYNYEKDVGELHPCDENIPIKYYEGYAKLIETHELVKY